jgi:hypothetical protein
VSLSGVARRLPSPATLAVVAVAAGVICFLAWPMLFTSSGMAQDWSNHLWYIWRQSVAIGRNHEPSLFLDYGGSVFYPFYAFYGGTIYALAGTLSLLLGHAPTAAYVTSYVLGFAATYTGWYWLARTAGLGRWEAQVPALLFISSAYYLTLIYARGDWGEFVAVSALPLLAAAAVRVLLAERTPIGWGIVLAFAALVFFGSHNITMLWGVTALALGAVAIAALVPQARRLLTLRGVLRVLTIVVPAALINSWYLLSALAYGQRSSIASHYEYAQSLRSLSILVGTGHLFTFSRASVVESTPDFVLALPVIAVAWVILSVAISLVVRGSTTWRRVLWVFAALGVVFAVLMTHVGLILDLPRPYTLLQFSYRLETYVLIAVSGSAVAILVLARSWPGRWRLWSWTALIVLIVSAIGAIQQVDSYPRGGGFPGVVVPDRYRVFEPPQPPFSGGLGDYNDASLPLVEPGGTPLGIVFPTTIHGEMVSLNVDLPAHALVHTNLTGAPYLVAVSGAKVVGHDKSGDMVLELGPGASHVVTLQRSSRLPVELGRILSRVALVFLLLLLLAGLIGRLRSRRTKTDAAPAAG